MRFLTPALVLSAALALGCGHTRTVTDGDGKGKEEKAEKAEKGDKPSSAQAHSHSGDGEKKHGKAAKATSDQGVPFAASPAGLLKPGAEQKIQDKLASDGLLKSEKRGHLDEPTREALRRFQDEHNLPATGYPDHETIRRLGLNPDEMFASKTDAEKKPASR